MAKKIQDKDNINTTLIDKLPSMEHAPRQPQWQFTPDELAFFNHDIKLYDYQTNALKNAIWAMECFFKDGKFPTDINKTIFSDIYYRFNAEVCQRQGVLPAAKLLLNALSIFDRKNHRDKVEPIFELMKPYYPIDFNYNNQKYIDFSHFINRISFWMATGSGKTFIIVKLCEILYELMNQQAIPKRDLLILIPRDDLITQLTRAVNQYNQSHRDKPIRLVPLKNYANEKYGNNLQFNHEIIIYYYRSDNLSDKQGDAEIDFKNYENGGEWYILLDEAHKGEKGESLHQAYYSIMSRKGFLFNFSATFIDDIDLISTIANFNLKEFIKHGYGKNIFLTDKSLTGLNSEYNIEEKTKNILKSLINLALVKKQKRALAENSQLTYHEPLLVSYVNSVNDKDSAKDSDLSLFFRLIRDIANQNDNELSPIFNNAYNELQPELLAHKSLFNEQSLRNIPECSLSEFRQLIFNTGEPSSLEILKSNSKNKEIAIKCKSAEKPFALIRIGDTSKFENKVLAGYEFNNALRDSSFFDNLEGEDSISILMGSRAFFEGWDSLRPNVICFINIGSTNAKRYILQSVGRGVRLRPAKSQPQFRMRIEKHHELHHNSSQVHLLESLFVYSTNINAVKFILEIVNWQNKFNPDGQFLPLQKNINLPFTLIKPTYLTKDKIQDKTPLELYCDKNFVMQILNSPNIILFYQYGFNANQIRFIKNFMLDKQYTNNKQYMNNEKYLQFNVEGDNALNINQVIQAIKEYISATQDEFQEFTAIIDNADDEDDIVHWRKIHFKGNNYHDFIKQIQKMANPETEEELTKLLTEQKITPKEFGERYKNITNSNKLQLTDNFWGVSLYHIAEHFYHPIITADENVNFLQNVINTPSECQFIDKLCKYWQENSKNFNGQWIFSKLIDRLDKIYIPYTENGIARKFYPDFIFWILVDDVYHVIFVDPKGTAHNNAHFKCDGFNKTFPSGKDYFYQGKKVIPKLLMFNDSNLIPESYRHFWTNKISDIFKFN